MQKALRYGSWAAIAVMTLLVAVYIFTRDKTPPMATGEPFGDTEKNLKSAVVGETHEYTDMYPGMAKSAREEGFGEIADWFETLAKAEKSHAGRFEQALNSL